MDQHRNKATILSVLFMGLGQIYNRQFIKGSIFLLFEAFSIYYFINNLGNALWGIVTLGETPRTNNNLLEGYDHSIFLMVQSLITLIYLAIFLIVYILNIKDARKVGSEREGGKQPNNFKQSIRYVLDYKFAVALLSIPSFGILFFTVMPIIFMIMIAFTNYSAPNHIPPAMLVDWVGFDTFKNLIALKTWSHTFYGVLVWTIIWAILSTATTYFGGMLVALLINQKGIRFKGMWRTILILPYAIPQLISLLIMRNMFNGQFGPINQYLRYFGIPQVAWLTDVTLAKVTVLLVNMWVGIPVSMLLIMGVLTTIPKDMYEAAEVDGATGYQKFKIVTLPMILFTTAPTLITQFAGNINNFNVIFLLTGGGPAVGNYTYAGGTDLLVTWLFKLTNDQRLYNMSSVVGIIIFVIIASFSIYNYRRTKSFKEEDMIQ